MNKRSAAIGAALLLAACGGPPTVGPISSVPPGRVPGALEWPIRGALVSAYRAPSRPSHAGVDLAAPPGTPVIAAEAGEVVYAGHIRGYEGVIAVAHPGDLTTVYAHLGDVRAAEHARVNRGEVIASVGDSGYLHYEIRRAKQPIDPAELYAIGPSPESASSAAVARADVTSEPAADVPIETKRPQRATAARSEAPPAPKTRHERAEPAPAPVPAPEPSHARARAEPPSPTATHSRGALGSNLDAPELATADSTAASNEASGGTPTPLVVGANLFYVPAKLGYAGLGAVTGVFILGVSQNPALANRFWRQTMGGDYWINGEQLAGEEPVHWTGTPSPLP